MVVRVVAGARLPLLLGLLLALGVRLAADDHFRTGGAFQDPFPVTPGSIIKADQRFHTNDPATLSPVHMFVGCHGGDTINPGTINITIPGSTLTWDATKTPGITWQGGGGSKVSFNGYSNSNRTMVFDVLAPGFTPITDHFNIDANTFGFANFTATVDPAQMTEQTLNGVFEAAHLDDGTIRVARPPSAFASDLDQSFSAGSAPVAMRPLTLQESSVSGNGAIWAQTGIRINIPAALNMTWDTSDTVASCSGTAVTQGRISSAPTVSYPTTRTVFIPVLADFQPSETVVISGLSFANFGGDSSGSLRVNLGTSNPVTFNHGIDTTTKTILGLPTLLSLGGNQVFTVGDPATNTATLRITESPGSPKINTTDDIQITIPASGPGGSNFVFDQTVTQVTCVGTAVTNGHMLALTTGVTYPGLTGKVVRIPVQTNFASNRVVDISGLRFTNFTDASPAAAMTLEVSASHAGIEDADNNTVAVGKPTISSLNEQVFILGVSPVAMQPLTITDDPTNPRITNGTQIRIIIPGTFNMTWEGGANITPVTGLNTAVSYANANKTLIVTANAGWTGSAVIQGLNFVGMGSTSVPDNLELWMSGAAGASPTSFDDKIIAIGGIPTISSTANQQFTRNDPITAAANNMLITDSSSPSLQNGRTLQLVIPAALNMSFDTTGALPTGTPGPGTGTVGALSFPDAKTLNIPITFDFVGNQTLSIGGLRFTNFTAASQPLGLQLKLTAGGPVATTDPLKKSIGAPTISSFANQTFGTGDPDTVSAVITIREDNGSPIPTPRIRNGFDIRIRIPSTFGMEFDPAVIPTLNVGTGSGTVTAVNFPTNKIMLLTVGVGFSANQTVTVTGAVFKNFTLSALNSLELEVNNTGGPANALDDKTIKVGTRPTITSVQTLDSNGNGSIDHLLVRYSEDVNGATSSVTKGTGFVIGGGSYTIALGVQDPFDFKNVVYTLVEKGLPDTGNVPTVRYVGASGNLTDVDDALKMNTVTVAGGLITDGAGPVITGFKSFDDDGNGRLDRVVFTFSENIDPTQADIHDWTLVDADGTTNLLLGLTNAEVVILNNTVTLSLANNTGSAADPRYRYKSDGAAGTLADLSGNIVAVSTNNHAPVANAGTDQTLPPTKVLLNGSASFDPDGQQLSYVWTQAGGGAVTLLNPLTVSPSFITVVPDTYTFLLTVSDGLTATQDLVSVTILNVAPTAVAIVDQVGATGAPIRLVGSFASDINGVFDTLNGNTDIVSHLWTQIGTPIVPISSPTQRTTDITAASPGVYVFEDTVTDSAGNISKDRVTVRVNAAPLFVPTANAGPDQVKSINTTVTLDGRLSCTQSPTALSYLWSPGALLNSPTSATPSFTPDRPGLYTFKLVVTDTIAGGLASVPDSVNILVYDPADKPPVAVAHKLTPSGIPTVGSGVTLDATGSFDPEGKTLVYAWVQTSGPAAYLSNPAVAQPTFTPALAGTYEFELVVYDGVHISPPSRTRFQIVPPGGLIVPISVSAAASNAAPAKANGHFDLSAGVISLTATFSPTSGPQVPVIVWEQMDGPAQRMQGAGPLQWAGTTVQFLPPVAGRYVFRVTALDWPNSLVATDDIEVIADPAIPLPDAVAGPNLAGKKVNETVTLSGSSNPGGATLFYWTQVSGTPVELVNGATATPSFVPPAGGKYIFQLIVSDGTAASGSSLVEVGVDPAPQSQASGGGSGGGGCGLIGLEPLLLLGLAALAGRRHRR